ncbi:unnamed protein product [Schistosoma rodhaini]|uniref:Uncharacterized protein n=1 Tax=Schistosoma rodhaini TaxID=6188 RepID=A0AA85FZA5_9TREM|nr:unnamed protein product [Schistosoma rodhaini]CAH8574651.1 unnamed protein product [Schistosoma rodhaini]
MKFKFTLLTSWTLLPKSIPDTDCEDDEAILFAQYLTEYTENKYDLNVFWPRQRGEAFLHNSFNSFEERFLTHSEYALLIVSGQNASCLDYIYPRFLVFFTAKKSWAERILIIFLKQPACLLNFDLSLLKHPPILFNDDSTNQWINDQESWLKIGELIKHRYIPSINGDLSRHLLTPTEYYISRWMSVTDLRGQPLAVRITRTGQSDSAPASWHDLSDIEPINGMKHVLDPIYPIGQRLSQSASVFEHSPTQSRDSTPNLHLHVNNFNRIRSFSSRCFTRKHQYYNTVFGLDPCWPTLSGNQLNVINNYSGVKCQIDETSHYENLLEKRSKHNVEIDPIYKASQMCIPQKQSKIKSCEFLNESILSCKLSNRIHKSTGIINDGSEYSNVITPNHTMKYCQRKIKLSPNKHFIFKEPHHICISSKKLIKLFKFKRKKNTHSICEKFGTQSQLELAKAVKTLSDVGQSLVEHSGDSVSNLNMLEIQQQQQPSCSYRTTDKLNLSCLSNHADAKEHRVKHTNNDDVYHQSKCSQITPIQSVDFSDSGLWSMSQMATEDCTNSLQQHHTSCSESSVFGYFTNHNNNDCNNSDQTNEIRLQQPITTPITASKFAEIKLSPWSSLKIKDGQQSKEFKLEKSNQTTDATTTIDNNTNTNTTTNISNEHGLTCTDNIPLNQKAGMENDTLLLLNCNSEQFVKDQLSNPSVSNVNKFGTNEALKLFNNDDNNNVTHDLNGPMKNQMSCTFNLEPFSSNSTSFEESKNDDESLHSHISKLKQNYPQENSISSTYLSKVHNNNTNSNNASATIGKDFIQLSTFQQNSLISPIVQNNSMLTEYSLPCRISTTCDVLQIHPTTKIYDLNNKPENDLSTVKVTDCKRSIGTHLVNNNDSLKIGPLQLNQDIKGIMTDPTLEQQNPYSSESTPLNTNQTIKIDSQIDINVNCSEDSLLISVECENNSTFNSDIKQNMNSCVMTNIQTLTNSLMELECTTHLPLSLSTDTSADNHYLNKSFSQSLDSNAENLEYLNVVTDHQTNQLQFKNVCLPKQLNEQLTTMPIIEDITELSSAQASTLFKQQKRDPLITPDHAHDVRIDERLSIGSPNGSISDQLENNQSVPSTQVKQISSSNTETSHEDMKPLYLKSDLSNTRNLDDYLLDNSRQNWTLALSSELTNKIDNSSKRKYDFDQLTKEMSNDSEKLSTDLEISKLSTEEKVSSDEISQSLTFLQLHSESVEVSCNKFHTPTKCHNREFYMNDEDISSDVSSTKVDHLQDQHDQLTNSEEPFVDSTALSISSNVNIYHTEGTNFYVIEPLNENTTIDSTNVTRLTEKLSISSNSLNNNDLDADAHFKKVVIKTENDSIDCRVKDLLQRCSLEDINTLSTIIHIVRSSSIQSLQATDENLLLAKVDHLQYPHNQLTNSEQSFMNTTAESLSSNVNKYCTDGTSISVIEPPSGNPSIDMEKLIQPTAESLNNLSIHNNNTFNIDTRFEFTSQLDVVCKDELIEDNNARTIPLLTAYKEEVCGTMHGINSHSKTVDSLGIESYSLSRSHERNADDDNDYMASDANIITITTTTTTNDNNNTPSAAPNDDTVPYNSTISLTFTDKRNILLSSDISDNNSLPTPPPGRDNEHLDYSNTTKNSTNISFNNSLELDFNPTISKLNYLMQYEYEFTDNDNNIYWIDPGSLNKDIKTIAQPMRSIVIGNSLEQPEGTSSIYNTPSQQLSVVPTTSAATTAIQNPIPPVNEIYIDEDYISHLSLDDKNKKGILGPKIDKGNEEQKSNQRFKFSSGAYSLFTSFFNLATLYVPRHIYWLYGATFTPREQFHRMMGHNELGTVRNPTNIFDHGPI